MPSWSANLNFIVYCSYAKIDSEFTSEYVNLLLTVRHTGIFRAKYSAFVCILYHILPVRRLKYTLYFIDRWCYMNIKKMTHCGFIHIQRSWECNLTTDFRMRFYVKKLLLDKLGKFFVCVALLFLDNSDFAC